jgi:hypothetical protein
MATLTPWGRAAQFRRPTVAVGSVQPTGATWWDCAVITLADQNSLRKVVEGQLVHLEGNTFQDCMNQLGDLPVSNKQYESPQALRGCLWSTSPTQPARAPPRTTPTAAMPPRPTNELGAGCRRPFRRIAAGGIWVVRPKPHDTRGNHPGRAWAV